MLIKSILSGVSGALLFAAMPAAAVVKIATYSGTVRDGHDYTGVFVAPGTDLTGYSWIATFTYDKNLGGFQDTDGSTYEASAGGTVYDNGSPIIKAEITINGVTRSSKAGYLDYVYTDTSPFVQHIAEHFFQDSVFTEEYYLNIISYPVGAPWSLDQNFGPIATTGGFGSMTLYTQDGPTLVEYADAYFNEDMTYSVRDAVPEPASWALMIAGFGMVGGVARRRRSIAVTA